MDIVKTDVLIVGAGPTGLALATALQKARVDHLVIDALDEGHNTSRAAVIHAHTLEMLDQIDVSDELESRGIAVPRFTIRDRDQALLDIAFDELPSAFRHLLLIPQSVTEAILQTRLINLGGEVVRGAKAYEVTVDGAGAFVRVRTATGERKIRARYVVGADGMHSLVREAAGILFQGKDDEESFVLADVRMEWPFKDEVTLFLSPAGPVIVAPLSDNTYRIVATLEQAPERPSIADIQDLLVSRGPTRPCDVSNIGWASRFRIHHRLAETYRKGPFVLMGDAAHVHSPAGGQGMNTGLVDAIVLANALTRVVRDDAPDTALDDYSHTRRPAAQSVLSLASRLTRVATMRSQVARQGRNALLRIVNRLPALKRKFALGLSGLARRRLAVLPSAGVR